MIDIWSLFELFSNELDVLLFRSWWMNPYLVPYELNMKHGHICDKAVKDLFIYWIPKTIIIDIFVIDDYKCNFEPLMVPIIVCLYVCLKWLFFCCCNKYVYCYSHITWKHVVSQFFFIVIMVKLFMSCKYKCFERRKFCLQL